MPFMGCYSNRTKTESQRQKSFRICSAAKDVTSLEVDRDCDCSVCSASSAAKVSGKYLHLRRCTQTVFEGAIGVQAGVQRSILCTSADPYLLSFSLIELVLLPSSRAE